MEGGKERSRPADIHIPRVVRMRDAIRDVMDCRQVDRNLGIERHDHLQTKGIPDVALKGSGSSLWLGREVPRSAHRQIVHFQDIGAGVDQSADQVGSDEAGAACHEDAWPIWSDVGDGCAG